MAIAELRNRLELIKSECASLKSKLAHMYLEHVSGGPLSPDYETGKQKLASLNADQEIIKQILAKEQ